MIIRFAAPITLAAALLVGPSPTDAFAVAPIASSSTFVQRTDIGTVVPYQNKAFDPCSTPKVSPRGSTALQMNLFDRFARVAKGNLNNVLKNLEAPEKIMNQAVEDMQKDLVKIRQSYAEITAAQRRLLKQKEAAESVAQDWYGRAQLAIQRGKEQLAREALARRQQQLELIKDLQPQIDTQAASLDRLYEGMQALENKILEAKSKKEQYIARAKTAESVQKINDMLGGITGATSMDAFTRMEEKVEALEAAAEASAEMSGLGNLLPGGSDALSLEKEFMLLEGSAAVDEELKNMKKKLLAPGSTSGTFETSWAVKKLPDKDIDSELEKIRIEISR